eukprot:484648-Amphidinium_carterae.1
MRQHLREVELREPQPILLKNSELDIALADILVKRLRRAALEARSRLRWWQQVNSSPVPEEDPQCVRGSLLDLVAGGGKQASTKRPYPFSGYTAEMFEQHEEKTKRTLEAARRSTPVVIVAHGSFNPVHFGHVHMMIRAKERLEEDGLKVVAGVMALAHRDWVQTKKAQVLGDDVRACLIDLMSKEYHQEAWLHSDERGVGFKSYWQMKSLLAMDYPGCTFYGVWGSDSTGTSFPFGPSVCVVRRGFEGPLQSVEHAHYVVHETHTHHFSSTKVRRAIESGDIASVNSMMCPALAWVVVGLFSPDPVERNTAHEALRLLDHTSSEDEDLLVKAPPAQRTFVGQGSSSSTQQNEDRPADGDQNATNDHIAKAPAEFLVPDLVDVDLANTVSAPDDTLVTVGVRAVQANAVNMAETANVGVVQAGVAHIHVEPKLPAEMRAVPAKVKAPPKQSTPAKAAASALGGGCSQHGAAALPPSPVSRHTVAGVSASAASAMPPPPVPRRQQRRGPVQPKTPPQTVKAIPKIVHNPPPRAPVRIVRPRREGAKQAAVVEPPVVQKAMPKPRILLKERDQQPQPGHEPPLERQQNCPDEMNETANTVFNVEGRVLKFGTGRLGGRNPTFDLLVEPTLSMLGRTFKTVDMDENDTLRIELGKEEDSMVVCFPSRQQFQHLTGPLDRVAGAAGCVMIDGFLTSWLFALLELEDARTQLRALLRNAIAAIKGQMVLSQLKVSIFGSENGFKLLRFYLRPIARASVERMAWEVAYLFNLYMDNCQRENGLRLLRCYILQAGDMQDDCEFPRDNTNEEYAFQRVAEGGGGYVTVCHRTLWMLERNVTVSYMLKPLRAWLMQNDVLKHLGGYLPLKICQGGGRILLVAHPSTSHVATFASMMHRLGYRADKHTVQAIVRMLEGSLRERLASCPPLQAELMEVDKLLDGSWCGEALRRDFIRGALLDLLVLASVFKVGVVILDDNENCRMNWPSTRTVVLRVDSSSLVFEPIAILDGNGKVCDLCVDLDLSELLREQVVWCGPTHLQVAAILYENVPSHLCCVPPQCVSDPGKGNCGSVSDTIPWRSSSGTSVLSVSDSSTFVCKQGGGGGGRSSLSRVADFTDDPPPLSSSQSQATSNSPGLQGLCNLCHPLAEGRSEQDTIYVHIHRSPRGRAVYRVQPEDSWNGFRIRLCSSAATVKQVKEALAPYLRCHSTSFYIATEHYGEPLSLHANLNVDPLPYLIYAFYPRRRHTRTAGVRRAREPRAPRRRVRQGGRSRRVEPNAARNRRNGISPQHGDRVQTQGDPALPSGIIKVHVWTPDFPDQSLAELEIRCESATTLNDVQATACAHLSVVSKYEHSCFIWLQPTSEPAQQTTKHFLQGRTTALQLRAVNVDALEPPAPPSADIPLSGPPAEGAADSTTASIMIDEHSVSPEELIHLRLEAATSTSSSQVASITTPSTPPIYVIRLSTHQQWSSVRGRSQVYKVVYGLEHTSTHLLQCLATKLKLHRRKINLLSRQITYLDSRFSLPMSARSTSSAFSQLPEDYPLNMVHTVYLYVSWQRTCTPTVEDLMEVCASLEGVVNSGMSMVEGGGRPQRVQYGPIAQAAFNKLLVDLQKSPQGLCIEHAFAEHLIHSDSKAARAIFQAQSPEQRLLAFAAALGRAGCSAYELGMRKAAVKAAGKGPESVAAECKQSSPSLVESADVQTVGMR